MSAPRSGPRRSRRAALAGLAVASAAALAATPALGATASAAPLAGVAPLAAQAPDTGLVDAAQAAEDTRTCKFPNSTKGYSWLWCYDKAQIRSAYGVDRLAQQGEGQTIVLVDAYGSSTAANDIAQFADAMGGPTPNFDQVFPLGDPQYSNANGNGQSGSGAAAGWAGEATLDIEWAYAIAPKAHIVLMAVPPAETLGVQGFPNLFKAIDGAIDTYPAGTVFSMSLGVSEETFGGAAAQQTAKFDQVFRKGLEKGDTFFASSGDDGTTGASKQHRDSVSYDHPTVGWPASSPYVTAVGGTQLQHGWTWNPQSDVAFTDAGAPNGDYFRYIRDASNRNVVWNESWLPSATGGGPSVIYPRPSWQDGVADRITDTDGTQVDARGVPDISWNAAVDGGVLVYTSFPGSRVGWHVYGGTSAASPQVAALTALLNEARGGAANPIGYLNKALYGSVGAGVDDVAPTHQGAPDVLSGDLTSNRMFDYVGDGKPVQVGPVPGHPVLQGWDETTGFGTPDAPAFVAALTGVPTQTP